MKTIVTVSRSIRVCESTNAPEGWNDYLRRWGYDGFHLRSEWSTIFASALRHRPHHLWVEDSGRITGVLPLMYVAGPLFGRFLVSQPYLNTGGVLADSGDAEAMLIESAVQLAEKLDVRHLELRHEKRIDHPALNGVNTEKVHMRLTLPSTSEELWEGLKSKLRSQVRKPLNDPGLVAHFGHLERLDEFYSIFCQNMRDLGTPPFSRTLFREMLKQFGEQAEICTVTFRETPVASGLIVHGPDVTLIPSASSLREFNHTSCNMLMYWHVLKRSVDRGQKAFDFGRSTLGSGTHKFKEQWGAEAYPAVWQYASRTGKISEMRPNSGKYDRMIETWKKLPVWFTRLIGPEIVRGIP
ncbi:MAG: FemAB family PEP-CTERM system-associated protein [Planctomyces sp.]|nr:FemAB family PEP-CTERM system-associated protein [Planctomyces sp.]